MRDFKGAVSLDSSDRPVDGVGGTVVEGETFAPMSGRCVVCIAKS